MASLVEDSTGPDESTSVEETEERLGRHYLAKDQFVECKKGGKIQLAGSSFAIPPGCMKHDGSLRMIVWSRASADLPENVIPVTPVLRCNFSHVGLVPGSEIEVEALTYCLAKRAPLPIALMEQEEDSNNWAIKKRSTLSDTRKLKFTTSSSSKLCMAFIDSGFGRDLTFLLHVRMYSNLAGKVKYYVILDDKPLDDEIKNENKKAGFQPGLVMPEPSYAKLGEMFVVVLQCERPTAVTLGENDRFKFLADDVVHNGYICRNFQLEQPDKFEDHVAVEYVLTRPNGETLRDCAYFNWEDRREYVREEAATKQPVVKQNVPENVNEAAETSALPQDRTD